MEKYNLLNPEEAIYINEYSKLSGDDASDGSFDKTDLAYKKPSLWRRYMRPILIHALLFTINLTICFGFWDWAEEKYSHGPNVRFTPVRGSIEYEERIFELIHIFLQDGETPNPQKPTHFNGLPSPALEKAWDDLVQYQSLRLTKEELGDRASEPGLIKLPDGGYFGTLTVYHSLHCVKRLHHFMYYDHYYANLSRPEYLRLKHHAEHCLDTLRQNIQCAADVTVVPFRWGTNQRVPLSKDDSIHECVNWEKVDDWARQRSVDPMQPGYLKHPTLGPAYPNGVGDPLGIVNDKFLGASGGEG